MRGRGARQRRQTTDPAACRTRRTARGAFELSAGSPSAGAVGGARVDGRPSQRRGRGGETEVEVMVGRWCYSSWEVDGLTLQLRGRQFYIRVGTCLKTRVQGPYDACKGSCCAPDPLFGTRLFVCAKTLGSEAQ